MPGRLRFSERLYGALLHLYPKNFRAAYSQQMRLTFRDACRAAYHQNGMGGLLALWFPTLIDLFKSALEERARQVEIIMPKERLIALDGPLTLLVGAVWLVPYIGDLVLRTGPARPERFWDMFLVIWSLAFFVSFVALLFALMGTRGGNRSPRTVCPSQHRDHITAEALACPGVGCCLQNLITVITPSSVTRGEYRWAVSCDLSLMLRLFIS